MGSFRRFASRSRVLYDNSDFLMISGFTMKLGALLLCLCIVSSQGRVLREKRETEEGLVDVAAEQENDTVEKKDEGFTNDSQEDVKARGAAFSKLVKTIVKNIPDGAVQKVKDAAVELVKGTVKKHLGMEEGDSAPEEPAKDIVVATDEEAGDTDEGMDSIPEETIVETDEVSNDSDEDTDVEEEEEIVIIVKNIPKGAVQKVKDAAAELVKGTVKKHLGMEEGDSLTEEPAKDKVVETDEEAGDNEEYDNDNNVSGVIGIKIIVKNIPKGTVQKIKDEAVDLVNGTVKKHLGLEEGDSIPEEPKKQKRDTNEDEEEEEEEDEVKQKRDAGENEEEDEDEEEEEEVKQKRDAGENEEADGKNNLSDLVGTIIDKIPEDTFEKVKEGLGNIPAIQVKEK